MNAEFLDVLMRLTPAEARKQLNLSARDLDAQVLRLTATLNGQGESPEQRAIFTYVVARTRESEVEAQRASHPQLYSPEVVELREWAHRHYAPESEPVPPEIMEWARRTFNKEEFLAGVREIEQTGGLRLEDFIDELEQRVRGRE